MRKTLAAWIQRCKQSRLRRFFQSSLLRILSDLRKCKTIKPLATIHFARQVLKRKTTRFGIHFGLFRASKPTRFCPRDKNETAGSRFRNSLRFCPRICPKRLREVTPRDSAERWRRPTTKLEPTGMTPQQTCVKEWEYREGPISPPSYSAQRKNPVCSTRRKRGSFR